MHTQNQRAHSPASSLEAADYTEYPSCTGSPADQKLSASTDEVDGSGVYAPAVSAAEQDLGVGPLPMSVMDEALVEVVRGHRIATAYIGPFAGDPSKPGRWSTLVFGRDEIDEHVSSDRSAVWNWRAHVRELIASDSPSDAELESALEELEMGGPLTAATREVVVGIDELDCESERAKNLLRALDAWDQAGTGNGRRDGRISMREHTHTYRQIAAALLDQLLADRKVPSVVAQPAGVSL